MKSFGISFKDIHQIQNQMKINKSFMKNINVLLY